MAKKGGKSKGAVSNGVHRNVAQSTLRGMRARKSEADKLLDKQAAWLKGGNPWITIENPNKEDTSRRFIRVRMNDLMRGTARERFKKMHVMN
jgi:hypothetical protein